MYDIGLNDLRIMLEFKFFMLNNIKIANTSLPNISMKTFFIYL